VATTTSKTETNKALVLAGIKGVFIDRDPTVLDRLFSENYQQHNPHGRPPYRLSGDSGQNARTKQ
jgi:hypothetical protein